MDIVFQPNGNFDEVYLYVSVDNHQENSPNWFVPDIGGAHGSRSARNREPKLVPTCP